MYEYIKNLNESIDKLITTNKKPLERTIELFAQAIIEDNMSLSEKIAAHQVYFGFG